MFLPPSRKKGNYDSPSLFDALCLLPVTCHLSLVTLLLITCHLSLVTVLAGCAPYLEAGRPVAGPGMVPSVPGVYHRVEKGQTLWRISKVYGVELDTLAAANRLTDAGRIEVGQQLFIPGATSVRRVTASVPAAGGHAPVAFEAMDPSEDFIWPVRGRVIAPFGVRTELGPNKGINVQAPEGTLVRVARSGRVTFVDENLRGFGKTLILDHGEELSTVYAHLNTIAVTVGQVVRRGEVLGTVGSTGRAPTPFLHFEVRRRHRPENPFYYLP